MIMLLRGMGREVRLKNVWKSDRRWEPENFENLKTFENIKNDHWDMLDNFCFHVYAQKSLIIGENDNEYFLTSSSPPCPVGLEFIDLVPS